MIVVLWLACTPAQVPPVDTAASATVPSGSSSPPTGTHHTLPGHDDCLPQGQAVDDATCLAVIAEDGRKPGESFDRSWASHDDPDPRVDDPDLAWLEDEIRRCTCACCHQSTLGAPGSYFWDLDFGPVWIDSASDWSLNVLAGNYYSENQFFPAETAAEVRAVIEAELARRDAARDAD
ncbi:MAG: hypothetical protein ACI8PZ_001594 [Myxococcota bacterium]|jgi:hypothetical protein